MKDVDTCYGALCDGLHGMADCSEWNASFLFELVPTVVAQMGATYPELLQMADTVAEVVQGEEGRFIGTLEQALPLLTQILRETKEQGRTLVSGDEVFKLYDTYGFPLDLVEDAAKDEGLQLDHAGYTRALEEQRERARKTAKFTSTASPSELIKAIDQFPVTQFLGYTQQQSQGTLLAMLKDDHVIGEAHQGDEVEFLLDVNTILS